MFGASTEVSVQAIEPNRRIVLEWVGYNGRIIGSRLTLAMSRAC